MKKVRVTYEAIVDDSKIKTESDVIAEGYDDIEDAILTDGLEGVIEGSYEYRVDWEISDAENEEFCKWKWGVDYAEVQCKGDKIIFGNKRLFTYCPYCSKKIKEV